MFYVNSSRLYITPSPQPLYHQIYLVTKKMADKTALSVNVYVNLSAIWITELYKAYSVYKTTYFYITFTSRQDLTIWLSQSKITQMPSISQQNNKRHQKY